MKFRGKRKDNGKEIKGFYFEVQGFTENTKSMIIVDAVYDRKSISIDVAGRQMACYEIHPESVAMFTTLLDKNKKEIYGSIPINGKMSRGGDLIDACPDGTRRYIRTVEWDGEFAQFRALFPDGSGQLFTRRQCLTYEVIGNIHEKLL